MKKVLVFGALALLVAGCCGKKANLDEGSAGLKKMTVGVTACFDAQGKLPRSSALVPANISDVSAKKYQSSPTDWEDPAFKCMKFSMSDPQSFQYQWELTSPTSGTVRAIGDFKGSGKPDLTMEIDVKCEGGSCTVAPNMRSIED